MALFEDSRGVSPAVTQALTIAISTILVTGLLVGGTQLIRNQEEDIARQGLIDIGSGVASDLARLDSFDTSTVRSNMSFESQYPERVGERQYRINLVPGTTYSRIYVNTTVKDYSTVIRFQNQTNVCPSQATGGSLTVRYNVAGPGCLEIEG